MLLHSNLMCWKQFTEVIPYLEKDYLVFAVSFDGFDGTGATTYTTAQDPGEYQPGIYSCNMGGRAKSV